MAWTWQSSREARILKEQWCAAVGTPRAHAARERWHRFAELIDSGKSPAAAFAIVSVGTARPKSSRLAQKRRAARVAARERAEEASAFAALEAPAAIAATPNTPEARQARVQAARNEARRAEITAGSAAQRLGILSAPGSVQRFSPCAREPADSPSGRAEQSRLEAYRQSVRDGAQRARQGAAAQRAAFSKERSSP
jgi:hypothetical protein